MPTSKTCLPDVNVWLALAAEIHQHHEEARQWFESVEPAQTAFCRVTQMGLLRLVSHPKVLGKNAATLEEAWMMYRSLEMDHRVRFEPDGAALDGSWKELGLRVFGSRQHWTDAYLSAFAQVRGWTVVTFDRDFERLKGTGVDAIVLGR